MLPKNDIPSQRSPNGGLDQMRWYGIDWSWTENLEITSRDGGSGSQVPRSADATSLQNYGLGFVGLNLFHSRPHGCFQHAGVIDHGSPGIRIHRETVVGPLAGCVICEVLLNRARTESNRT